VRVVPVAPRAFFLLASHSSFLPSEIDRKPGVGGNALHYSGCSATSKLTYRPHEIWRHALVSHEVTK
jgi:hypothetical protein